MTASTDTPPESTLSAGLSMPEGERPWWLYLLACKHGRTYAGIALDVDARFQTHCAGKGARFTRANPPVQILAAQSFATKSDALRAEAALKKLRRTDKLQWARRWAHNVLEK